MRRALRTGPLAVALALTACGGGDGVDAPATTSAPAATASTAGAGPATTAAAGGETCDAPAAPGPATGRLDGLALGGGSGGVATTHRGGDGWHLRVELGGGRGTVDELLTTAPSDTASVAGARDLDGDGDDELLVVVARGAAAEIYGVYDLDGCDLEAVQLDGAAAELAVGGGVVELHGLRCEPDGGLTELTARSEDGLAYSTSTRTFALRDGTLVPVASGGGDLAADAPDFPAYSRFDC